VVERKFKINVLMSGSKLGMMMMMMMIISPPSYHLNVKMQCANCENFNIFLPVFRDVRSRDSSMVQRWYAG
jgi:hypothetical protein